MKILLTTQYILFICFAGYYAQGSLYPQGNTLSQTFLIVILGLSSFFFIKSLLLQKKSLFYIAWTLFFLLNVFGFLFTGSLSDPHDFSMFKGVLLGTLPFYPFYFFAQRGILTEKRILHCFIFILPIAILQFFYNADNILSHNILYQQNSEDKNIVNNIAYNFVALIPFVFFIRKKILSIACIGLLMFFIIQGAKRGALITGVIAMVFFVYYQMRTINKRNRVKSYLILFVGISVLLYYVFNFYQNNQYLISRMQQIQETGGSGRNLIYADIFNGWLESDTYIHLLFGYGFAASWKFAGNFAHNDWLELLSNFGLLGVVIYGFLFYATLKYIRNKQISTNNRLLMVTIVFIWFAVSLFSMGYTNVSDAYLRAILLAFLIGNKNSLIGKYELHNYKKVTYTNQHTKVDFN